MKSEHAPGPHPFCPPPGTRVDDWCLLDCLGHGAFGAVHRAVRVGQEAAGPVALKLALYPWDPRFMREVALLSLVQHPGVPRLLGHGFWKVPAGTVHPYIVMQWVEGLPLYDWAQEHNPSSRQVLQLLAQLARVLQATHEACAVHRDVKGANVRVRLSDGRAMLMDFGAGHYQSAPRLTWQSEPPGTPAYRSPEASLFWIRSVGSPNATYVAKPADDLFALGVTAYRLVTGDYPAEAQPRRDRAGQWQMEAPLLRSPQELNARVSPLLSTLILRMLSLSPEARGTAVELADALEAAVENAGPEADQRLREGELPRAWSGMTAGDQPSAWVRAAARVTAGTVALAGVLLVLWTWQQVETESEGESTKAQATSEAEAPDAGTAAVGDAAPSSPLASVHLPAEQEAIAQDLPPKPFQGQARPDEKGQCPSKEQVPINGACWVEQRLKDAATCEQNGYVVLKGKCFAPAFPPRRKPPPMSGPEDFQ